MIEEDSIQEDQQEWIYVIKNKKNHRGSRTNKQIHDRGSQNILTPQHKDYYAQKFVTSKAFDFNQKTFKQSLQKTQTTFDLSTFHIECLGLGNFSVNKKCFIQLKFLQLIIIQVVKSIIVKQGQLKILSKQESAELDVSQTSVNIYDPVFSKSQLEYISSMKFKSSEKYEIEKNRINIFFMPHCERNLYQSVYEEHHKMQEKNTTPLLVIGNSIEQYKQRCLLIKQKIPDVFNKIKITQTKIIDYENALNDTFIMI